MAKRKPTIEVVRNLLSSGSNDTPASELKEGPVDPLSPTMIKVEITNVFPYDNDLRIERNAKFEEIKDSIRARGLDQSFGITRRPGEEHYTIARGGNTRLTALKELYEETQDPQFLWQELKFIPWDGERTAIIGHLVENDLRADFTFFERARGVGLVRSELEEEAGKAPSLRKLAAYLAENGYKIDTATLMRMVYALTELEDVLPQALRAGLGEKNIRLIRKTVKDAEKILVHEGKKDAERNSALIGGVLNASDRADWSLEIFTKDLEARIANEIDGDVATVRLAFASAMTDEALDDVFDPEQGEEPGGQPTAPAKNKQSVKSQKDPASDSLEPATTVKGKREQHLENAAALARLVEMEDLIQPLEDVGFGYVVKDVPAFERVERLASADPGSALRVKAVWFHLVNLSGALNALEDEQVSAAVIQHLPEDSMLKAALQMQSMEALSDVADVLSSPGLWAQHLLASLTTEEWSAVKALEGTYRALANDVNTVADAWMLGGQTEV
ncbi:MAG: ParB family protein [Pseudomonadota bacterium]